jgi:hypothetical protein
MLYAKPETVFLGQLLEVIQELQHKSAGVLEPRNQPAYDLDQ